MGILREPMNGLTHCCGVILAVAGGIALLHVTLPQTTHRVAISIYLATMVLLYTFSTLCLNLMQKNSGIRKI